MINASTPISPMKTMLNYKGQSRSLKIEHLENQKHIINIFNNRKSTSQPEALPRSNATKAHVPLETVKLRNILTEEDTSPSSTNQEVVKHVSSLKPSDAELEKARLQPTE